MAGQSGETRKPAEVNGAVIIVVRSIADNAR